MLAPLILPLTGASGLAWAAREQLHNRLCDLTLRMAREHVPFWHAHLPASKDYGVDQLKGVPSINRSTAEREREGLISPITSFGFCSMTSGTTSGQPLLIERSSQEHRFLSNLFGRMLAAHPQSSQRPLGIVGANIHHGDVLGIPGHGYALTVNLYSDAGYAQAASLLFRDFDWDGLEHRVSSITASFACLFRLFCYLRQRDARPPRGQIRNLCAFGAPIPLWRREEVAEFFGAQVHDNWSMTESFGGAAYCHRCDGYHMSPFVHEELLALDSDQSIDTGIGELTITPLFPFAQRFVLIRYRTGDLVERVQTEGCVRGRFAFRPLGRRQNCVVLPDGGVLSTVKIAFALDRVPGLRRPDSHLTCLDGEDGAADLPMIRLHSPANGDPPTVEVYASMESAGDFIRLGELRAATCSALAHFSAEVKVTADLPSRTALQTWKL